MAAAAVRVPDPRVAQLPLRFAASGPQIFIHEGARQALERRLQMAHGGIVQLAVTDNRRRMVTHTRSGHLLKVRLHMMFLDAPEKVVEALVRYVVRGDRDASDVVGEFIEANSHRIRGERSGAPIRPRGQVHDLEAILSDVNDRYFNSAISDVLITWGNNPAEMHPVLFSRFIDRRSRGDKVTLIDISTRRTRTTCRRWAAPRPPR